MRDHTLVTGGSGKTGGRLVTQLRQNGAQVRTAQRSPHGDEAVRFDWLDAATYDQALANVRAIYLVAPSNVTDVLGAMRPFLEKAISQGVEQFVLLSSSMLDEGGPMMGEVHAFLKQHAPRWVVLRPTWFMQNFSEQQHLATIRDERTIYSATGDGRAPFIDAGDIASVAAQALLDTDFPSRDFILTGPETLSYDQVAQILSEVIGQKVIHHRLSESEAAKWFISQGIESNYADILAGMDRAIADGDEDRITNEVHHTTGHTPTDFKTFATAVRKVWTP